MRLAGVEPAEHLFPSGAFAESQSPGSSQPLVHLAVFRVAVSHRLPALVLGFLPGLSLARDALFRTAP